MTRSLILSWALLALAAATPARAEIAVLRSGGTLKVSSWSADADRVLLRLVGGGEVELPSSCVVRFVPDEVASGSPLPTAPALRVAPPELGRLVLEQARRETVLPKIESTAGVDAVLARARTARK